MACIGPKTMANGINSGRCIVPSSDPPSIALTVTQNKRRCTVRGSPKRLKLGHCSTLELGVQPLFAGSTPPQPQPPASLGGKAARDSPASSAPNARRRPRCPRPRCIDLVHTRASRACFASHRDVGSQQKSCCACFSMEYVERGESGLELDKSRFAEGFMVPIERTPCYC